MCEGAQLAPRLGCAFRVSAARFSFAEGRGNLQHAIPILGTLSFDGRRPTTEFRAVVLASTWALLEGQITIVLESTSHEKTGATGACEFEARVSRMTFDESGLCADPSKMLEMSRIIVRNRPTRD
jgi:hypothetical protein